MTTMDGYLYSNQRKSNEILSWYGRRKKSTFQVIPQVPQGISYLLRGHNPKTVVYNLNLTGYDGQVRKIVA
jgi:hypothetical protein